MSHTPGPWAFLDCALVQDTGNRLHLGVFHEAPGLGRAAPANARLIAAAPSMLFALREAQAFLDGEDVSRYAIAAVVRAAIAHATGEEA